MLCIKQLIIKQLILFVCFSVQLQAASVINSGLVSTSLKICGEDHILVSMIIPVGGLQGMSAPMGHDASPLKICVDIEVNRQKQLESQEIRAAGYSGPATSPKSMALDLMRQLEVAKVNQKELTILKNERRSLKRKLDEAKKELYEAQDSLLEQYGQKN